MLSFATNPLNFILLLLSYLLLLLLFFQNTIHADHLSEKCTDAAVYTTNSRYETNLKTLVSSLSTTAPSTGFSNESITGSDPADSVFGLVLCRGDQAKQTCQSCLDPAVEEIEEVCPNKKNAIIWFPNCMVRYSNEDFFGTVDAGSGGSRVLMWNVQNISEPDNSSINARDLVDRLVEQAASSPLMFATGNLTYDDGVTRYGLVQCTRDLSADGCKSCLVELAKGLEECCRGKKGWRILAGSCNIRFEDFHFFENGTAAGTQGDNNKPIKIVIIGVISSLAGVFILVCCVCFLICRKKRSQREKKQEGSQEVISYGMEAQTMQEENDAKAEELPLIDLGTIQQATNYFNDENKLGEGGFGPVHKGMLPDGKEIAVKRLSKVSVQGLEEFKNEISLIAKLQHRNLVRLLYCCVEKGERLLVYEYMPNTSLDAFLFDPDKRVELDWSRRRNIVIGIVRGLLYLHEDSRLRIIHRDLKASNVLLDEDMNPKISDFGLARIYGGNESGVTTNRIVGTYGYMAPEYALEGLFSVKSDAFSFGVLLLEIISGQRNHRFYFSNYSQSLLAYVWRLWSEGKGIDVIDPLLIESCPTSEALRWIHIALLCVQEDPIDRPNMSTAIVMLGSETVKLPRPKQPAFSMRREANSTSEISSNVATSSSDKTTFSNVVPR